MAITFQGVTDFTRNIFNQLGKAVTEGVEGWKRDSIARKITRQKKLNDFWNSTTGFWVSIGGVIASAVALPVVVAAIDFAALGTFLAGIKESVAIAIYGTTTELTRAQLQLINDILYTVSANYRAAVDSLQGALSDIFNTLNVGINDFNSFVQLSRSAYNVGYAMLGKSGVEADLKYWEKYDTFIADLSDNLERYALDPGAFFKDMQETFYDSDYYTALTTVSENSKITFDNLDRIQGLSNSIFRLNNDLSNVLGFVDTSIATGQVRLAQQITDNISDFKRDVLDPAIRALRNIIDPYNVEIDNIRKRASEQLKAQIAAKAFLVPNNYQARGQIEYKSILHYGMGVTGVKMVGNRIKRFLRRN